MELLELYRLAERQGIAVECFDLPACKCVSLKTQNGSCYIGIDPFALLSVSDEKVRLAHEMGHCNSGAFYSRSSSADLRSRCEARANGWAIKKLIPKNELISCYKSGICDNAELADHFGVTEDFLQMALEYYNK